MAYYHSIVKLSFDIKRLKDLKDKTLQITSQIWSLKCYEKDIVSRKIDKYGKQVT